MSVCVSARNSSATIGRILAEFDIWGFIENPVEKIQVPL